MKRENTTHRQDLAAELPLLQIFDNLGWVEGANVTTNVIVQVNEAFRDVVLITGTVGTGFGSGTTEGIDSSNDIVK